MVPPHVCLKASNADLTSKCDAISTYVNRSPSIGNSTSRALLRQLRGQSFLPKYQEVQLQQALAHLAKPGIETRIWLTKLKTMVAAILVSDVSGNKLSASLGQEDNIGFHCARRVDDETRAQSTMMADTSAKYQHVGFFQLVRSD